MQTLASLACASDGIIRSVIDPEKLLLRRKSFTDW